MSKISSQRRNVSLLQRFLHFKRRSLSLGCVAAAMDHFCHLYLLSRREEFAANAALNFWVCLFQMYCSFNF